MMKQRPSLFIRTADSNSNSHNGRSTHTCQVARDLPVPGALHVHDPRIPSVDIPQGHKMVFEAGDQRLAYGEPRRRVPHGWPNLSQRASAECSTLLYNRQLFPGQVNISLSSPFHYSIFPSFAVPVELCLTLHSLFHFAT